MLKRLEIGSYMDGYNFSQINCSDIPIAAIAGFFDYNNYFYYCFFISVLLNWKIGKIHEEQGRYYWYWCNYTHR